jgi:GMP synthase (glutamine-hydrolysing)
MAILVFEHTPNETASRLGVALRNQGHRLRVLELHEGDALPPDLDEVDGILALGGPMNLDEQEHAATLDREMALIQQAHKQQIPVVGICLGAQMIAKALGGDIERMETPEVGWKQLELTFPGTMDPILTGIPWRTQQVHLHSRTVSQLPEEGTSLASSAAAQHQAFKVGLTTYAFQFHFEWTKADIETATQAEASLLREAGEDPQLVQNESERHYELYRHLGDRLCNNLAMLLLPIDKRYGARPGEPVANFRPEGS